MISIAFCIPTRNFGAYIGHTLDTLLAQMQPQDQIIVLDGNSSDDTPQILCGYVERFSNVVYERRTENGGIDCDLSLAVESASADYCWLFGADDAPAPGAVDRVRALLATRPVVCLIDRVECDVELKPRRSASWLAVPQGTLGRYDLSDPVQFATYLDRACSLGALFSYISAIVIRRGQWGGAAALPGLIGSYYLHSGCALAALCHQNSSLLHIAEPLVYCRGDNDSFAKDGQLRRMLIDVNGFRRVAEEVFPNDRARREAIFAVFRRLHPLPFLIAIRALARDQKSTDRVGDALASIGYPRRLLWASALLDAWPGLQRFLRWLRAAAMRFRTALST